MAKTTRLSLDDIAHWNNVVWALRRACRGKQHRPVVQALMCNAEKAISQIGAALKEGRLPIGQFRAFEIVDPKKRTIHAAPLLDRIAHHALVRFIEPTLERVLLPSVFACRVGKGVHAAIDYAQQQCRRYTWVIHLDIEHYFPAIDHRLLLSQLHRRFRGDGVILLEAVVGTYQQHKGKGLPIGALTSQHFGNGYLNNADRWSLAYPGIQAHCRYMDDFLLWSNDRKTLLAFARDFAQYLGDNLALRIKEPRIKRTDRGVLFCGMRIKPFSLLPSQHRRRRYRLLLNDREQQWRQGQIDSLALQRHYSGISTILKPAEDKLWRLGCIQNRGAVDA